MQMHNLPNLSTLPPIVLQGDPDGEIERAVFALLRCDIVGAVRLALTISNPYRRAVWLRGFRRSTIEAARQETIDMVIEVTAPANGTAERK